MLAPEGAVAVSPSRCTSIGTSIVYSNMSGANAGVSLPLVGTSDVSSGEQPTVPSPVNPAGQAPHLRALPSVKQRVSGSQPPSSVPQLVASVHSLLSPTLTKPGLQPHVPLAPSITQ